MIGDIALKTSLPDDQQWHRGVPDPYILVKSVVSAVGDRRDHVRGTATPSFTGPYTVAVKDSETIEIEVWDYDGRAPSNDDFMESVRIELGGEMETGRKTFELSKNGSVTLTWRVRGRTAGAAAEPVAAAGGPTVEVKVASIEVTGLAPLDGRSGTCTVDATAVPGHVERCITPATDWGEEEVPAAGAVCCEIC